MTQTVKVCCKCGVDVSGGKRVKDLEGRYYCTHCLSKIKQASAHATAASATSNRIAQGDDIAIQAGPTIEADDGVTTKKCPMCAEIIRIDAKKCRFCGTTLAGDGRSRMPIIFLGGLAGALFVAVGIYMVIPRDNWEVDHRDQVEAILSDARSLAKEGRLDASQAKFREALGVVGNHPIRGEALKADLKGAQGNLDEITRQMAADQERVRLAQAAELAAAQNQQVLAAQQQERDRIAREQQVQQAAARQQSINKVVLQLAQLSCDIAENKQSASELRDSVPNLGAREGVAAIHQAEQALSAAAEDEKKRLGLIQQLKAGGVSQDEYEEAGRELRLDSATPSKLMSYLP